MQNAAIWISNIFGPFMVILGLWMLIHSDQLLKVIGGMKNSPALFYVNSVFNLLMGLTILSQYELWDWNLFILVTLLGWFMVIRGAMGFFIPHVLITIFTKNRKRAKIMGLIPLVWGLFLSYAGFFV